MGYVPKFIHFDHFIDITYPFGVHWKHSYIQQCAEAIFNTYKEDIDKGTSITFVVRGTSGAMIAGAILNQLNNINPTTKTYILVVRKEGDNAHGSSLRGIDEVGTTRFIVVDDFIVSGETIEAIIRELDRYFMGVVCPSTNKYDMLCISNLIDAKTLKKNSCDDYRKWKGICSRFKYVVCCPKPKEGK